MNKGKVYLAGSGPGDPDLLTVKTKKLINDADVIIYDSLIGDSILCLLPETSEKHDVGKRADCHPVSQEEINRMLISFAQSGKKVLRLKGGDPFVFGRGAEEVEALIKENISYEIVPGISSAIAAPAYAGIPVTHRDYNSSFHVITGHRKNNLLSTKDFNKYANLSGSTLVFLMSTRNIDSIVEGLLSSGMKKETPCAIISNGTRYNQMSHLFTLKELSDKIGLFPIETPGLFVVGEVCNFAKSFTWFYDRPLHGKRIILTRPEEKKGDLSEKLVEYGAEVINFPTIKLFPLAIKKEIKELSLNLTEFEWILFTSSYGVKTFFRSLIEHQFDFRKLYSLKFAVVGPDTGKELSNYGFIPDFIPSKQYGYDLASELLPFLNMDKRVLLILPKDTPSDAAAFLKEEKIPIHIIESYDKTFRKLPFNKPLQNELFVFTSPSTVEGVLLSFSKEELEGKSAVCIGKKTAAYAEKTGFKTFIPDEIGTNGILKEILKITKGN